MRRGRAIALGLLLLVLAAFALGPGRTLIPAVGVIPVPSDAMPTAAHGASGLLVRLNVGYDYGVTDTGFGRHTADYLSDGTVIRWINTGAACEAGRPCGTLERNTLTTAGLATVRARLAKDADLMGKPANINPQADPNMPAPETYSPVIVNTFVLEQPDGSRYDVSAPSASSHDATSWAPDPAIDRLNALAKDLADPATLVGTDGLASPTWTPYKPDKTAVYVSLATAPSQADPTPYVDEQGTTIYPFGGPKTPPFNWLFQGDPTAFGAGFSGRYGIARCAFLPSADAIAAITSRPEDAAAYLASGSDWQSESGIWHDKVISLTMVSLLPEDVAGSCADALSY